MSPFAWIGVGLSVALAALCAWLWKRQKQAEPGPLPQTTQAIQSIQEGMQNEIKMVEGASAKTLHDDITRRASDILRQYEDQNYGDIDRR